MINIKKKLDKNIISRLFIVLGLSGVLYCIIMMKLRKNLNLFVMDKSNSLIFSKEFNDILPSNFEMIIFAISILIIFCIPLINANKSLIQTLITMSWITLFILDLVLFSQLIITGRISKELIVVTYLFIIISVWILVDIFKLIYNWLINSNKKEKQIDVAKITFVWAVITFVLNLIWLGR